MKKQIKNKLLELLSYPVLGLIYLLSLSPMFLLYMISDIIYFLLYKVIGYRKLVTQANLKNAFPKKSHQELKEIEAQFYTHFCDILVETIKSFTISGASLKQRMKLLNPEVLEHLHDKKISLIAVTGHYGNWEWAALSLPLQSNYKPQGIYLPLKNRVFNKCMINSRGRFGLSLISTNAMIEKFEASKNDLSITGFIADQSPSNPTKAYWMSFLNQETAVSFGTEKYARDYKLGVVFGKIAKLKRGYYTLEYTVVTEDPSEVALGQLTQRHAKLLEAAILEKPQFWLWTHKRWKHRRPEGMSLNQFIADERPAK
jgi:KDO2-lipid IV(A) lauroyltransferase